MDQINRGVWEVRKSGRTVRRRLFSYASAPDYLYYIGHGGACLLDGSFRLVRQLHLCDCCGEQEVDGPGQECGDCVAAQAASRRFFGS
jgi:hypothetical protein